jgi:hypothetical protein
MFGHNDDDQSQPPASTDVNDASSAPTMPSEAPVVSPSPSGPAHIDAWQHPGAPLGEEPAPAEISAPSPPPPIAPPAPSVLPPASHDDPSAPHDLIDLKQQALSQLTPIVGHLDQTPEEKFRTLMMMIQATDDQSMLKEAYDTAQKITDEKTKAQALLDVVNEINYFTQHKN